MRDLRGNPLDLRDHIGHTESAEQEEAEKRPHRLKKTGKKKKLRFFKKYIGGKKRKKLRFGKKSVMVVSKIDDGKSKADIASWSGYRDNAGVPALFYLFQSV
jgi:hypothetical protein